MLAKPKVLTLEDAVQEFGTEAWFIEQRWPNDVACADCGSLNIQRRPSRKLLPFRCRDCRNDFRIKTGTIMGGSRLPLSECALDIYL